jgi:hypothetical protein
MHNVRVIVRGEREVAIARDYTAACPMTCLSRAHAATEDFAARFPGLQPLDARLGTAQDFCARLAKHGVAAIGMGPNRVRMVTHLDVSSADIDRAAHAIAAAAAVS